MRYVLVVGLVVMLSSTFCFAQMPLTPNVSPLSTSASETKILSGKVDSVTVADPVKGTKSEITIVDEAGNKTTVSISPTTKIYDNDWKTISLDQVKKDDSIKVTYAVIEGINEAVSVNLKK